MTRFSTKECIEQDAATDAPTPKFSFLRMIGVESLRVSLRHGLDQRFSCMYARCLIIKYHILSVILECWYIIGVWLSTTTISAIMYNGASSCMQQPTIFVHEGRTHGQKSAGNRPHWDECMCRRGRRSGQRATTV
jgi:hypothetical protein